MKKRKLGKIEIRSFSTLANNQPTLPLFPEGTLGGGDPWTGGNPNGDGDPDLGTVRDRDCYGTVLNPEGGPGRSQFQWPDCEPLTGGGTDYDSFFICDPGGGVYTSLVETLVWPEVSELAEFCLEPLGSAIGDEGCDPPLCIESNPNPPDDDPPPPDDDPPPPDGDPNVDYTSFTPDCITGSDWCGGDDGDSWAGGDGDDTGGNDETGDLCYDTDQTGNGTEWPDQSCYGVA